MGTSNAYGVRAAPLIPSWLQGDGDGGAGAGAGDGDGAAPVTRRNAPQRFPRASASAGRAGRGIGSLHIGPQQFHPLQLGR